MSEFFIFFRGGRRGALILCHSELFEFSASLMCYGTFGGADRGVYVSAQLTYLHHQKMAPGSQSREEANSRSPGTWLIKAVYCLLTFWKCFCWPVLVMLISLRYALSNLGQRCVFISGLLEVSWSRTSEGFFRAQNSVFLFGCCKERSKTAALKQNAWQQLLKQVLLDVLIVC